MSSAPLWVAVIATAVGAMAAIAGSMWASRVQWRSAARAEWFRRLQWAWELTRADDRPSAAAGTAMMDYLAGETDRKDAVIIDRVGPIAREIGRLTSAYPSGSDNVDISVGDGDTEGIATGEEGDRDGIPNAH